MEQWLSYRPAATGGIPCVQLWADSTTRSLARGPNEGEALAGERSITVVELDARVDHLLLAELVDS